MPFLVAFDTALPAFCAAEVRCGDRKFAAGEPFPWRDLNVTELELHTMWRGNFITFRQPEPTATPAEAAPLAPAKLKSQPRR